MSFIVQPAAPGGTTSMIAAGAITQGFPVIATTGGQAAQLGVTTGGSTLVTQNNLTGPGGTFGGPLYVPGADAYVFWNDTQVRPATFGAAGMNYGTAVTYSAAGASVRQWYALPGTSKFVLCYVAPTTNYPTIVIGSLSGNTVTMGTPVTVSTTALTGNAGLGGCFWDANTGVVGFSTGFGDGTLKTYAFTVSGLVPTIGAQNAIPYVVNFYGYPPGFVNFTAQNKILALAAGGSATCSAVVITVSGNTVTAYTTVDIGGYYAYYSYSSCYDSLRDQALVYCWIAGDNFPRILSIGISGTTPSGIATTADGSGSSNQVGWIVYDSVAQRAVVNRSGVNTIVWANSGTALTTTGFQSPAISSQGAALTYDSTRAQIVGLTGIAKIGTSNFSVGNCVGVARNTVAPGGTVIIGVVGSVNDIQGLTAGSSYQVLTIGGMAPVTSLTLGQYLGVALTSGKLLIKG